MLIGLISDIHANRAALKAVLEALAGVDQIWCAGDITGYYPDPNGVIDDLMANQVDCIKGNHDWYLENPPAITNDILQQSLDLTRSRITPANKNTLQRLPLSRTYHRDGLYIRMYHGSPWDILEEYIYPDYNQFEKFSEPDADIIILGHTHYPMLKKIRDKLVINPGSCGQPRDGNTHAAYAVLDTRRRTASLKRISYDASSLRESIQNLDLDKKLLKYLPSSKA